MEMTRLSESDYVRYFGSDSPLQVYQAYWKFDGGWESLWSYVLEKVAIGLGMPRSTSDERERETLVVTDIANQLRLDAAGEAVMSAKYNAGARYGIEDVCTIAYDEAVDGYVSEDMNGEAVWYYSEQIVDMQQVAKDLAYVWQEYEG